MTPIKAREVVHKLLQEAEAKRYTKLEKFAEGLRDKYKIPQGVYFVKSLIENSQKA